MKWFFETTHNTFSGANDPIHETFRAQPYYSIVRESIQNSMDVQKDKSKPVEMRFEIVSINQIEHPELFSIRVHIENCLKFHSGNKQAEGLYGGMIKYLDENPSVKILKVSDYNTEGMNYHSSDYLCPFTSFMSEGISSKISGSGGSFGFGKGAYYVPSVLRTILVSTMVDNGNVYFQGRTRLASHKIDGEIKGKDGVFKLHEREPLSDATKISPIFRRTEQGTDVYILGMLDDPNCGREMIKSVLNNFWLAVHENRLDITIKTEEINVKLDETNLEELINEYFPEEIEQGLIGDIYNWNPKAYYKAVKYAKQSENFMLFEKELPILKNVRFYVYRKEGLMNRTSFMRKPAMTVNKSGRSILSGYAAVFICDNDTGNEYLRQMENAAHNEWQPENVRFVSKDKISIYHDAKKELNEFIRDTLKSISGIDNSSKIEISGLSEYLTIPEELLDNSETTAGNAESNKNGNFSYSETENETGSLTTKFSEMKIKPRIHSPKDAQISSDGSASDDNQIVFKGGGSNDTSGGDEQGEGEGNIESPGQTDNSGANQNPIPIIFRVAAINNDGDLVHNLILNSDDNYSNVTMLLKSATDNGSIEQLSISETDTGKIQGKSLINLKLIKGKNIIKVKFADNMKHALNLSAYEVK